MGQMKRAHKDCHFELSREISKLYSFQLIFAGLGLGFSSFLCCQRNEAKKPPFKASFFLRFQEQSGRKIEQEFCFIPSLFFRFGTG